MSGNDGSGYRDYGNSNLPQRFAGSSAVKKIENPAYGRGQSLGRRIVSGFGNIFGLGARQRQGYETCRGQGCKRGGQGRRGGRGGQGGQGRNR